MNNFMSNNLSQAFYPQQKNGASNYAYEINLDAVNKSINNNSIPNQVG